MTPTPFGLDLPASDAIGQWVLRILGVAGAAAIGGLVVGLVTQGLSRLLTTKPVPRVPLNIVRLLGAVVCGWLAVLLLFGGGPGGFGWGGGGSLFGGGGPGGTGKEAPATSRENGTGREGGPGETSKAGGRTLDVEILDKYPAVYRVLTDQGPRDYSSKDEFEKLTDYLLTQKKATPPVTGVRVVGRSDPGAGAVVRLTDWARKEGFDVVTPPSKKP